MIYFDCKDGRLPPVRKLLKGKPQLERLMNSDVHFDCDRTVREGRAGSTILPSNPLT